MANKSDKHHGLPMREAEERNSSLKSTANSRDESSKAADERANATSGTNHNMSKLRKDRC